MNNSTKNSQDLSDSVRKLSPRQQRAIVFLISSPTQEEACKRAGVTRETINKWMKDPAFEDELENQRQRVFGEALATLKQSVNQAVLTLRSLLDSSNEGVRLRASLHFIRLGLKVREELELKERVQSLEEIVQAQRRALIEGGLDHEGKKFVYAEDPLRALYESIKGKGGPLVKDPAGHFNERQG
jgi:response regulator RpfG family c-di-GMP phosphodiesterase